MTRSWVQAIAAACAAVFLFQLAVQPAALYPGDPAAIRAEASYLIAHGRFGIPFADAGEIQPKELLPPSSHEDQYLWANRQRGRYFSRWGVLNTLAFVPPLFFTQHATPAVQLHVFNAYDALLAALLTAGLLCACAWRGLRAAVAVPFVLAWVHTTYLGYYLRAQSAEIVQCTLAAWVLAAFCLANARLDSRARATGPIVALNLLLVALMLAKIQFSVWWVLALICTFAKRPLSDPRTRSVAVLSGVMLVAGVSLQLALNVYKFGGPFELGKLGYPFPHETAGWGFSVRQYASSLPDFLWGKEGGIVYHAPLAGFAILGALVHARTAPRDATFLWSGLLVSIFIAGALYNHNGGLAFGPRYLVQSITVLCIAGATAFAGLLGTAKATRIRWLTWGAFAVATVYGAGVEAYVGSYHPFAAQMVEDTFRSGPLSPGAQAYFGAATRVQFLSDLGTLCERGTGPLADIHQEQVRAIGRERAEQLLKTVLIYCHRNVALLQR